MIGIIVAVTLQIISMQDQQKNMNNRNHDAMVHYRMDKHIKRRAALV